MDLIFVLFFSLVSHSEMAQFAPPLTCEGKSPPADFCAAVEPQSWTAEETARVDEIMRRPELSRAAKVFEKFRDKMILHRMNYGATYINDIQTHKVTWIRDPNKSALAWYDPIFRNIVLPPQFFKSKGPVDTLSGNFRNDLALVHEIFHMIDRESDFLSLTDEFTQMTGWYWNKTDNVWETSAMPAKDVNAQMQTILELLKEGSKEWYATDRQVGTMHGYPTVYALTSRQEMFAEIATYILFDPNATTYLDAKIIAWFDAHVFLK